MELDETKARDSKADRRLEKPFDAEALRSIVRELVPATKDNAISQFLTFPDLPNIIESEQPKASFDLGSAGKKPDDNVIFDLEEPEEFQAVPLPKSEAPKKSNSAPKDDWSHQDLSRYKIDLFAADTAGDGAFNYDEADLTKSSIAVTSGLEDISLDQIGEEPAPFKTPATKRASASIDSLQAEEILRQEARKVLETIAWKMIPDIVERVVREELQKLLKDAERL